MNRFSCVAHGLSIRSQIPLPEYAYARSDGDAEIKIQVADLPESSLEEFGYDNTPEGFRVWFTDVGRFFISRSGTIDVLRPRGVTDASVRLPLLGSVIAVALHYRGVLALHGNALAINGDGVVILGDKGQGKSTLTAYLVAHGHQLVSDDVSAVTMDAEGKATVHKGALQLKLWPDSLERCFGRSAEDFMMVSQWSEKRSFPAQAHSCTEENVRLRRIYILGEDEVLRSEPVTGNGGWRHLVTHTHPARFGSRLLQGESGRQHFTACAQLAQSVPMTHLFRPKSFDRLAEVKNFIEADLAG